jgi:hypothetical protein
MPEGVAVVATFFEGAGTAAAVGEGIGAAAAVGEGAAVVGSAAATAGATEAGLLAAGATAGEAAAAGAALGGTMTAATVGGTSMLGTLGTMVGTQIVSSVVSNALAPKPLKGSASSGATAPTLAGVTGMPDPLAQEAARKKSLIEQVSRRGRASTILTENSNPSGRLGG